MQKPLETKPYSLGKVEHLKAATALVKEYEEAVETAKWLRSLHKKTSLIVDRGSSSASDISGARCRAFINYPHAVALGVEYHAAQLKDALYDDYGVIVGDFNG